MFCSRRISSLFVLATLALSGATQISASPHRQTSVVSKAEGWSFAIGGDGTPGGQSATEYMAGRDKITAHSGTSSVTIKSLSDKPQHFRAITQGIRANAYRGKRLCLSGYLKSNAVTSWSGLWLRVDGVDRELAFDNMFSRAVKGTTDWTQYKVVLDVPDAAGAIYFGVAMDGTGQIWADDLTLEVVDPNQIATTDTHASEPSQLVNLDFETAPTNDSPGAIPGWIPNGGSQYDCSRDTSVRHGGTASATLKSRSDKANNFVPIIQAIAADAYRGKRVRLTGYLKTDKVKQWAGLWMNVAGTNESLTFDNMHDGQKDRSVKGTTDWQPYSIVLDVPQAAQSIRFGALLSGPGQLWVDDLALETVDPQQTASTDVQVYLEKKTEPEKKKRTAKRLQAQSRLPLQPANLDFER